MVKTIKHIILFIYGLTCVYPFVWMIGTSLKTSQDALANPQSPFPKGPLMWSTFSEVWSKLNFSRFFVNSVVVSVIVIVGVVVIYTMMAFAFAKFRFKGKKLIYYTFIALLLVPGVTTLIPLYINMTNLGLQNSYVGIILPMINGAAPFAIFLFTSYFGTISHELYECAVLDGCGNFKIYWRIYLPLALPAIGTIAILNFIGSWNNILWPMIIIDKQEMFTLPMGLMYLDSSSFKKWNELMAGALITVIPVLLSFPFMQKMYVKGMTVGSVKM
ncbi:ABC transporter permease subunit [Paenibacillus sp. HJL G12]|uniref:ABC transporter permease subunit n=1 Tax=Paenibacillus dendrobii TaxID=2691084 RepID=A0A7X3IEI6_9BACL|nr:carbohydrate ABC transporter permease [Paenibacillus dendrobii]MWV42103.1 ABC transporter permease subunit [Paenibacillus dendrobii]